MAMGAVLGMALGIDMLKRREESRPAARNFTAYSTSVARARYLAQYACSLPGTRSSGYHCVIILWPRFPAGTQAKDGGKGGRGGRAFFSAHGDVPLISPDRPFEVVFLADSWVVYRAGPNQLRQLRPTGSTRYDSRKQPWLVFGTQSPFLKAVALAVVLMVVVVVTDKEPRDKKETVLMSRYLVV